MIVLKASLKTDEHHLNREDLVSWEIVEPFAEDEMEVYGYIRGYVRADCVMLLLGRLLEPVWEALKTLKTNANISVQFQNDVATIQIKCEQAVL